MLLTDGTACSLLLTAALSNNTFVLYIRSGGDCVLARSVVLDQSPRASNWPGPVLLRGMSRGRSTEGRAVLENYFFSFEFLEFRVRYEREKNVASASRPRAKEKAAVHCPDQVVYRYCYLPTGTGNFASVDLAIVMLWLVDGPMVARDDSGY